MSVVVALDIDGNELPSTRHALTTPLGTFRASVAEATGVHPSKLWLVVTNSRSFRPAWLLGGKARLHGGVDDARERSGVDTLVPWMDAATAQVRDDTESAKSSQHSRAARDDDV